MTLSCLKCSTMDPWLKLKFPKHHKIRIWTFSILFSASNCHRSPRHGFIISNLVYFEISLIVTKWLILFLKCSTMDTRLKLKFPKRHEIRIWTFLIAFSASKCRLSPRLGIVTSKFSIFRDILDCNKLTLCCLKCSSVDPRLKLKFLLHPKIRI